MTDTRNGALSEQVAGADLDPRANDSCSISGIGIGTITVIIPMPPSSAFIMAHNKAVSVHFVGR